MQAVFGDLVVQVVLLFVGKGLGVVNYWQPNLSLWKVFILTLFSNPGGQIGFLDESLCVRKDFPWVAVNLKVSLLKGGSLAR